MSVVSEINVNGELRRIQTVPDYGVCYTAAATAAKAVAPDGFSLAAGARISVKFTYGLTVDNPTLNVNGTGAKPIVYYGETRVLYPCWEPGEVVDLVYDGTSWCIDNGSCYVSRVAAAFNRHICFSSETNFTLKTYNGAKNWNGTLEWSTDAVNWNTWTGATTLSSANGKLYLRGTGNTKITGVSNEDCRWVLTGDNIMCDGNIETLLDYATARTGGHPTMAVNCFRSLFNGCTSLLRAPALPATTLAGSCYQNMFCGCTSLIVAPALPATTLANNCYFAMFRGCSSLLRAPALPATTLKQYCYYSMFRDCAALAQIPALPAITLAEYCYRDMFHNCAALKLSTSQSGVYQREFRIPTTGTGTTATNAIDDMFTSTGGSFTGTPTINKTYYTTAEPVAA